MAYPMGGMKPSCLLFIALVVASLGGCAIVPLEPYGPPPHHYHGGYGYRDAHEHRDRR